MEIEPKNRGADLLPGKQQNYEKELEFIMNSLIESAVEDSVKDILAELTEAQGEASEVKAERVRDLLLDAAEAVIAETPTLGPQSREEALKRGRTTFFLTAEARHLIRTIAREMGLTQAAMLEITMREKAFEMKIPLWTEGGPESKA